MEIGVTFLIIAGLIMSIWILIEIKRMKHKLFAIFLIVLILFVYVSMMVVFKGKELNYKSIGGLQEASTLYFSWLGSAFGNVKSITNNAIKMDWGGDEQPSPENATNG